MLLKPAVVVKTFVDHTDCNDGVNQPNIPGDLEIGSRNQRDAMPQGESGDKFENVFECA